MDMDLHPPRHPPEAGTFVVRVPREAMGRSRNVEIAGAMAELPGEIPMVTVVVTNGDTVHCLYGVITNGYCSHLFRGFLQGMNWSF